jgi:hypothetical protein
MRKLRTIHTMDVRGRFALRHSSQICLGAVSTRAYGALS